MDTKPVEAGPITFDGFYAVAYPRLVRALTVSLSSHDLAHNAADEAMTRAYARWDEVSGYGNPQGWCYRVGLNYGRSVMRRFTRRPRPAVLGWSEDHLPHPELWQALRALEPDLRDVVVCRALYELSVRETAELLRTPEGTVKSRYSRARSYLQQALAPQPQSATTPVGANHA